MKAGVRKRPTLALDGVLAYRNPRVTDRYLSEFGGSPAEADGVFVEMLKWLYLSERGARRRPRVRCVITTDLAKLDDMWHTFLLFTRDYMAFCERRFGGYKHHEPDTGERSVPLAQAKRERRAFYALVYDTFGEETFRDWFMRGTFSRSKGPAARRSGGPARARGG